VDRQPALTVRVATLSALGGLYVAQGLPYGFFTQTLPVVLKQHEVGLEAIGLSSLLALPWALKALWAPLVDRLPRRATLLALQLASVALLIGLSLLDPGHLGALAAVILTINLLAATQDIATDGLAVRTLTDDDRGLGNALQVAGYRAGMIVGGGALLSASGWLGWSWTVLTLAGLTALATLPALAVPDAPPPERPPAGNPWGWLALPGALPWCLVLATFKLGDYLGQGMLRPWLVDEGLSVELLGLLLGLGGFGAGLVGALIGGWSVPRLGLRPALIGAGALQVTGALLAAAAPLLAASPAARMLPR
jgi:MFS family permease